MPERDLWPEGLYQKLKEVIDNQDIDERVVKGLDPPGYTLIITDINSGEMRAYFYPEVDQLSLGLFEDDHYPNPYSETTQKLVFDSEDLLYNQN